MTLVHINIGSNQDKKKNIKKAIYLLSKQFNDLVISNIYQSKSASFVGNDFYNFGANFTTNLTINQLIKQLKDIENIIGRKKTTIKFSPRVIDIDLVLFGSSINHKLNIPRNDILKYNFVLKPIIDLMPDYKHPILQKTYLELWENDKITANFNLQKIIL